MRKIKRIVPLSFALFILYSNTSGIQESARENSKILRAASSDPIVLNVYNWEDYIMEGDEEEGTVGLIEQFEEYCLEDLGQNVTVNYSTFDTNETMMAELRTGKAQYDLICPSDYVIQRMINEDLIQPYDEGSTPNYDTYVSPFIDEKIGSIEVVKDEETISVSDYARGYMWGTLGLLYNTSYSYILDRGITEEEMDKDMLSWTSLWDEKYRNLISIKDSMRDTYAIGILKALLDDFELDGEDYEGFTTLKSKFENGEYSEEAYNEKATELFNLHDNTTMNRVLDELNDLKDNAYGFEIDSGKTDMARGMFYAINVAWSGDAALAMDDADAVNEERGEQVTNLKYAIPQTGANLWFDGWVIPKNARQKEIAQEFVDFLSRPDIAAQNMEWIGYTPVIAGDDILDLLLSWYDIRWDEENELIDESYLEDYELTNSSDIYDIPIDERENYYYQKDISYFFNGTLYSHTADEAMFALSGDMLNRQFDTQYPDSSLFPSLVVMADFGSTGNADLLMMWENFRNTPLPTWAYILILVVVVILLAFFIYSKIKRRNVLKRRRERKEERVSKERRKDLYLSILLEGI